MEIVGYEVDETGNPLALASLVVHQIVNSNLIKYGIATENDPIVSTKHITIFDTPMERMENN